MTNPLSLHKGSDPDVGISVAPTAKQVNDFHRNADTNRRPESIHHSLGTSHNTAAYGDHTHDGSNSQALIPGDLTGTFTENLGTYQGQKDAIKQIITLLKAIGALDSTTVSGNFPEIRTGRITVTWTAAGAASDIMNVAFSPPFTATPMFVAMIRITTTPTNVMSVRQTGSITVNGVSIQIASTVSLGAGSSCAVDWIAINMVNYT